MYNLLDVNVASDSIQSLLDTQQEAEYQTFTAILNCYIREFALPNQHFEISADGTLPMALTSKMLPGKVVTLELPNDNSKLAIKAEQISLLGRGRFNSAPFLKQLGKPWRPLAVKDAIKLILIQAAAALNASFNQELYEQIENSIDVTHAFLKQSLSEKKDTFISSEQSLLWGHPLHPSPKSRSGVSMNELLYCSPEIGTEFQLYWFNIHPSLLVHQGDSSAVDMIASLANKTNCYPCHPWEVVHIKQSPLYQRARERGLITPIGYGGVMMAPTSSVRTLYHADQPFFLKCSIHVRLTNCVRKNAWYELESAVFLTTHLKHVFKQLEQRYPRFKIMREPAATSLNFSNIMDDVDPEEQQHLEECFGLLYRENLTEADHRNYDVVMAGAIFAWDKYGQSVGASHIRALATQKALSYQQASLVWLSAYFKLIVPSILSAFFDDGIILEPHLQNTLIGLEDGLPNKLWIRDLEGTKLDASQWSAEQLSGLSDRAQQSVLYTRELGWKRIAYCLLINNLSEAIFHLSNGDAELEQLGWNKLTHSLSSWKQQPEIARVLVGEPIPSKNNLRTRLQKLADKASSYTLLAHPLGQYHEQ